MNRKSQDSTDDLLRALRTLMDQDDADEQGTPDDVFGDRTSSERDHKQQDEEIAAFDSYMAALLGEAIPGDVSGRDGAKKTTRTRKKKTKATPEASVALRPEEELVELTAEEPEADVEISPELSPPQEADEISPPDVQVELPGEVLGEEVPTFEDVYVTEEEDDIAAKSELQIIEQLRIPTDSFGTLEATEETSTADELPAGWTEITAIPASNEGTDAPVQTPDSRYTDVGLDENGMPLPIDFTASDFETETEPSDAQEELLSLHEGDIILDADDDIPEQEAKESAPETQPVPETPAEDKSATVTPVSSPLDAARNANARAEAQRAEEQMARPKQSPLDAIAAGRMGERGNVTSLGGTPVFGRSAGRERSLTDDDVELLLELGYESNLSQKVGAQRVELLKHRRADDEQTRRQLKHVYGCTGEEYTGHAQDDKIKKTYQKHLRAAKARLFGVSLLTILALLSDIFPMLRDSVPSLDVLLPTTGLYGAVGLLLLVLTALICLPHLKRGLGALVQFAPIPASLATVLLVFTLLYGVYGLFMPACPILLNFPTALALLLLCVGERMRVGQQQETFEVISAHSRKIAAENMAPRKKKVVRNGHIVKIINDDADRVLWRIRPTEQVAGYFRRTGERTQRYRPLGYLLAGALIAAVIVATMTLLVLGVFDASVTAFLLTLQLSLPLSALVSYAYPLLSATKQLAQQGCAIVGESAVDEYSGEKTLLFDDTEMFRSKSSTEITIKGGGDTRKYIRYAKRLFYTIGGTLRNVTTSDLSKETYEERVEILRVMEEGIEARIDGKVHILAGTSAFMVKNGIRVPGENAELLVRRHVESCILYLAFDGKLRLGYEIDYRISGRFEQAAEQLFREGTAVAIETYDPSIHAEFLSRSREEGRCPIRVVKPVRFEKASESQMIDSGLVATRSARDIARLSVTCDRLARTDRQLCHLHRITLVLGAALSGAAALLGMINVGISLAVVALQVALCLPVMILTRKNILDEQDQTKEYDNRNRESIRTASDDLL